MMQIRCPQCRSILQVREETAGQIVACPTCRQQLRIPAVVQPAVPVPAIPRAQPVAVPAPSVTLAEAGDPFTDLGADEPLWKRDEGMRRYTRPINWRFLCTAGGVTPGSLLGAAIGSSWGLGMPVFIWALTRGVFALVSFSFLCLLIVAGIVARFIRIAAALGRSGFDWRTLLSMCLTCLVITAPLGAVAGAYVGAVGESFPASGWFWGRFIFGALLGGVLGAIAATTLWRVLQKKTAKLQARLG